MMTPQELPHMPAPIAPPPVVVRESEPAHRPRGPQGQLHLTTAVRWCLRDGPGVWQEGARARARGERRCSPPQHGRLRRQWLAGWDAADRLIQRHAAEELRAARADWDQILEGLAGNPASKLLSGHGLPRRLDKAIACVEEASRVEAPGKRGPGRPPGELGKARKVWEARNAEIRADYDANMAFAELETKYGITEESMRVYMKQAGWPMRGTRGPARQKRTATSGPLRPSPGVKPKQPAAKKTGKKR